MKLIWFNEALDELDDIYTFYYSKSPDVAVNLCNSIISETDYLLDYPYLAAIEPILADKNQLFRSLVTKDGLFKIVYYVQGENIFITRIFCCRRDPKDLQR